MIVGGYDNLSYLPCVFRIDVCEDTITEIFSSEKPFGVAFGGQMDCIQRIVFGTDEDNQIRLKERTRDLLLDYRQKISAAATNAGVELEVPHPDTLGGELDLFNRWGLNGLEADIAEFSEQNAIDCVDFFIEIMIRAQAVSSKLPTVGGDIKVAVIRKDGFHFVSRHEWKHEDHSIQTPGGKSDREKTPVSDY